MIFTTFCIQALAIGSVFATPIDSIELSREAEGHIVVPGDVAPEIQELKPRYPSLAANIKRTKIRYGKYTLPPVSEKSLMSILTGEDGTMSTLAVRMKKPCEECGLAVLQAGLEYENGTVANTDTGAWLHHIVVVATGAGRQDAMCPILPIERFFSSGNERSRIMYTDTSGKSGNSLYPIKPTDAISMQIELMNLKDQKKDVYLTLDYEYIPGPISNGWKTTKAVWLDITNCGISFARPPKDQMNFTIAMRPWNSTFNGNMLHTGGHLHDGGVNVKVYKNQKVICDSQATYTKKALGSSKSIDITKRDGLHGNEDMPHIEAMSACTGTELGPLKVGDEIHIDASYDFNKHMGMKSNRGGYADIMGIALLFVAT